MEVKTTELLVNGSAKNSQAHQTLPALKYAICTKILDGQSIDDSFESIDIEFQM